TRSELELEKHLWALTALHLRNLDKFARNSQQSLEQLLPSFAQRKHTKILEIGGNVAELYQLSAIYPTAEIHYLTLSPHAPRSSIVGRTALAASAAEVLPPTHNSRPAISLPDRITQHPTTPATLLYLPFASHSLQHIRSSSLPALLPASQLPALLKECHRVLAPGGLLELRLVEPVPERGSAGPLMEAWIEEHVIIGLERRFRCLRPGMLVPGWVRKAGFRILASSTTKGLDGQVRRRLRLPAAVPAESDGSGGSGSGSGSGGGGGGGRGGGGEDVDAQVAMLVGRALWWDVWGGFVEDEDDEGGAGRCGWWEDEEVVRECEELGTAWEVGTLFAVKERVEGQI
ncbi:hypothetical protein LTS18_010422, partial [Coniosporium uncinatum]